eukprot:3308275-Rhodomonas_salina.1
MFHARIPLLLRAVSFRPQFVHGRRVRVLRSEQQWRKTEGGSWRGAAQREGVGMGPQAVFSGAGERDDVFVGMGELPL